MREKFTDRQIAEFLRRSYFVVDGLWFVKTEEKRGFEEAMEQDEAVWDVMSKVQARKARSLLGIDGDSIDDLVRAFQFKLTAEGYEFDVTRDGDQITLSVGLCPWYEVLKSSGRTQIAEIISERICAREFSGWLREFAPDIEFNIANRLCVDSDNCTTCRMVFSGNIPSPNSPAIDIRRHGL